QATSIIPIVMATVSDAVEAGFVASVPRPGGNVTGLSWQEKDLSAKRLQLLQESLPKLSRVAVLNPGSDAYAPWRATEAAAQTLHLELLHLEVPGEDSFESALVRAQREHAEALSVLRAAFIYAHRKSLV